MTQLTTFEEFVEVVKTNPTLRTQLFEALGLLALGAAQQEAITELVALRKDVDGLVTRVDGLDVKVDGLVTKVDGLDVKVDGLVTKVDRLGTDVHSLNSVVLGGELEEKASKRCLLAVAQPDKRQAAGHHASLQHTTFAAARQRQLHVPRG